MKTKQLGNCAWSSLIIAAFLTTTCPQVATAQQLSSIPVDVEIPKAPTPVRADSKMELFYELHITNLRARPLELQRIEVLLDHDSTRYTSFEEKDLDGQISRPGAPADLANKRIIGPGMRAVVFIELTFFPETVPTVLRHRLSFKTQEPKVEGQDSVVEISPVTVNRVAPLVISPPLRGEGWLALNGPSNTSDHRRSIVVVNGKARIAQRFAIDWTRIGADGQAFRGDPANNANWSAYGADVLAVADAKVADLKDGIPQNDPTADHHAVPITLETVGGNYLILDLGNGYFAFYAHLQPGSLRVKIGDRVRTGQALAKLGNSGNSDAPHLHFHITDGNSPLGAEGVPFVFREFEVKGILPSIDLLTNGKGWMWNTTAKPDHRSLEIPMENEVVLFR